MRRVALLQAWLACYLLATAVFVETGGRRFVERRNPYAVPLAAYRARDRSREVVFLGSSVVGCGVVPGAVAEGLKARGVDAGVYSVWFTGSVLPTYDTTLREVVLRQRPPRLLVLCLTPRDINTNAEALSLYARDMGSVGDVLRLVARRPWDRVGLVWPLLSRPPSAFLGMASPLKKQAVANTLARAGSRWWYLPGDPREAARRNDELAPPVTEEHYQERLHQLRDLQLRRFDPGDFEGMLGEMAARTYAARVPLALCLFDYSDRAFADLQGGRRGEMEAVVERVSGRYGIPVIRLRQLSPRLRDWHSYYDGADHLRPVVAEKLSRELAAGPLADLLAAPARPASQHPRQ